MLETAYWANKVNIGGDPYWSTLTLSSSFEHRTGLQYCKDEGGCVHVNGVLIKTTPFTAEVVVATLPVGYRPTKDMAFPVTAGCGRDGLAWCTYFWVLENGNIRLMSGNPPDAFSEEIHFALNFQFRAKKQ